MNSTEKLALELRRKRLRARTLSQIVEVQLKAKLFCKEWRNSIILRQEELWD